MALSPSFQLFHPLMQNLHLQRYGANTKVKLSELFKDEGVITFLY